MRILILAPQDLAQRDKCVLLDPNSSDVCLFPLSLTFVIQRIVSTCCSVFTLRALGLRQSYNTAGSILDRINQPTYRAWFSSPED